MANNDSASYVLRFNSVLQALEYSEGLDWVEIAAVTDTGITQLTGDITAGPGDGSQVASIAAGAIVNADINASAAIDASKIANGLVSNTEFQFLDGVTSAIQTQLDGIQPAGGDTEVQFNTAGAFDADPTFTFDGTALHVPTVTTGVVINEAANAFLNLNANGSVSLSGAGENASLTFSATGDVDILGTSFTFNGDSMTPSVVDSAATVGGAATESVTVDGLLTTSTIWAVTQRTKGGSNLPLLSWSNTLNGSLTVIYSADMGVGAVVRVLFIP